MHLTNRNLVGRTSVKGSHLLACNMHTSMRDSPNFNTSIIFLMCDSLTDVLGVVSHIVRYELGSGPNTKINLY